MEADRTEASKQFKNLTVIFMVASFFRFNHTFADSILTLAGQNSSLGLQTAQRTK